MNIEEVQKIADAWQEENEEGRAIMVIAIDTTKVSEEESEANTVSYVSGPAFLCKEAIKAIIIDGSKENAFRKIMSRANLEAAVDKLMTIGGN